MSLKLTKRCTSLFLTICLIECAKFSTGFSLPPNGLIRHCSVSTCKKIFMGWEEGFSDLLNNLRVDRVRFPARSWQSNEPLRLGGSPEPSAGKPRDQVPQPPAEPLVIDVADVDAEAALAAGNYTLAVWTAASSRFTFYYDEPESHLILAGRAILTPVDRDGYPIGPPVELPVGRREYRSAAQTVQ